MLPYYRTDKLLYEDLQVVRPLIKSVLIKDTVTAQADDIFPVLLKNHEKRDYPIHFFVFERSFKTVRNEHPKCVCHDFTIDVLNWLNQSPADLKTEISRLRDKCVVVIDSLAQVIYRYGLFEAFQIFNELNKKDNILQTLTVLHTDLLENKDKVLQCFQHIATLHMEVLPEKQISYTLKQSSTKIRTMVEEYSFDAEGNFITKKKAATEFFVSFGQKPSKPTSTFKIDLSEKDKQSRNGLVLPYLPKDDDSCGGKIHYTFDGVDDWDHEDPDDDLDI